jgi:hypothetical protein
LCACGRGLAGTDVPARLMVLVQALFMLPNMAANKAHAHSACFYFQEVSEIAFRSNAN